MANFFISSGTQWLIKKIGENKMKSLILFQGLYYSLKPADFTQRVKTFDRIRTVKNKNKRDMQTIKHYCYL